MDWILQHLQLVFLIVVFVVGWLTKRGNKGDSPSRTTPNQGHVPRSQSGSPQARKFGEDADSVRRVQEEIQRKILQRLSGGRSLSREQRVPPPLPVPARTGRTVTRDEARKIAVPEPSAAESSNQMLEEYNRLEQRRREVKKAAQAEIQERNASAAAGTDGVNAWASALREPGGLRRAVVLNEILGRPVGLR